MLGALFFYFHLYSEIVKSVERPNRFLEKRESFKNHHLE